jgi:predicted secreted protein
MRRTNRQADNPWILFLAGCLVMLLILQTYQGPTVAADDGNQETMVLTKADNGKTVEARRGDVIRIELDGSGGTGYWWYFDDLDGGSVQIISESTRSTSVLTGGPTTGIWILAVIKPGDVVVTMRYYRIWEGKEKAADTFSVTLNAR